MGEPRRSIDAVLAAYCPPESSFEIPDATIIGDVDDIEDDEDDDDEGSGKSILCGCCWKVSHAVAGSFNGNNSYKQNDHILQSLPSGANSPKPIPQVHAKFFTASQVPFKPADNTVYPHLLASRPTKVIHIDYAPPISKAGVRGMVTNVSHGTFYGQPSSLIIFCFLFRSGDHAFRFKATHIRISFSSSPGTPATFPKPVVRKLAPRKIYGLPTSEGKRNTIGGEVALQVPAGQLTVGPTVRAEREWEYMREHRFATVGNFWSSSYGAEWDVAYWETRENKKSKSGIPDTLNIAVVVEREGTFSASVEVTVDTPFGSGPFACPWTKSSPATFIPGVCMGQQPRTDKFEDLTTEEWKLMIPYEEEWENRFTEESMSRHSLSSVDSDSVRRRSLALTTVQEEQKRIPGGWSPTFREIDLSAMESVESLDE